MTSRKKDEPILYYAARLIMAEHDDLVDSAPHGTLVRLEQIASELEGIEDRL